LIIKTKTEGKLKTFLSNVKIRELILDLVVSGYFETVFEADWKGLIGAYRAELNICPLLNPVPLLILKD
jgi:hypothetical protein